MVTTPASPTPWTVVTIQSKDNTKDQEPLYHVAGPGLSETHAPAGILLTNREDAYAIATAHDVAQELETILDICQNNETLDQQTVEHARTLLRQARGKPTGPHRRCGTPGCKNPAPDKGVQIGPGAYLYVCAPCSQTL